MGCSARGCLKIGRLTRNRNTASQSNIPIPLPSGHSHPFPHKAGAYPYLKFKALKPIQYSVNSIYNNSQVLKVDGTTVSKTDILTTFLLELTRGIICEHILIITHLYVCLNRHVTDGLTLLWMGDLA